jgi:hypothetical protein
VRLPFRLTQLLILNRSLDLTLEKQAADYRDAVPDHKREKAFLTSAGHSARNGEPNLPELDFA